MPVARSVAEIQALLEKHGATDFGYVSLDEGRRAALAFRLAERTIRYAIPLPQRDDRAFSRTKDGWARAPAEAEKRYQQALRSRWREVLRLIDAKLIAVASGIVAVEDEFLSWTVTPGGATVGEIVRPQLEEMHSRGRLPGLGAMVSLPPGQE